MSTKMIDLVKKFLFYDNVLIVNFRKCPNNKYHDIIPITHPWKQASYLAYLYNNKRTEEYAYN